MVAKNVESLRQKSGNGWVVRLMVRPFLIDDKWGFDETLKLSKFVIIRYSEDCDKYLPKFKSNVEKVPWWDSETYNELKEIVIFSKEDRFKPEKIQKACELFSGVEKTTFLSEDWDEAQTAMKKANAEGFDTYMVFSLFKSVVLFNQRIKERSKL